MYFPKDGVESVYWIILAAFFGLTILSWWVARKDWLEEDAPMIETHQEQDEEPSVQQENIK